MNNESPQYWRVLFSFSPSEFQEALDFFEQQTSTLYNIEVLSESPQKLRAKYPTLSDQIWDFSFWVIIKDALVIALPLILSWLAKGKKIKLREGNRSAEFSNLNAEEVRKVLEAWGSTRTPPPDLPKKE